MAGNKLTDATFRNTKPSATEQILSHGGGSMSANVIWRRGGHFVPNGSKNCGFALIRAPKVSVLKCVTYSNQIAPIRSVSLTVTHCPAAPLALGVCPFGIQTFDQGA